MQPKQTAATRGQREGWLTLNHSACSRPAQSQGGYAALRASPARDHPDITARHPCRSTPNQASPRRRQRSPAPPDSPPNYEESLRFSVTDKRDETLTYRYARPSIVARPGSSSHHLHPTTCALFQWGRRASRCRCGARLSVARVARSDIHPSWVGLAAGRGRMKIGLYTRNRTSLHSRYFLSVALAGFAGYPGRVKIALCA